MSKWFHRLSPDTPISDVARCALDERLARVTQYLPLAAEHADEDVEHVHQLRVATRRAAAALDIFGPSLPRRRTRKLRRALKKVRRAAGDARDLDVLHQRLSRELSDESFPALRDLLEGIRRRRCDAQQPIVDIHARLRERRFAERVEQLLARIGWRGEGPEPDLATEARRVLRPLVAAMLEASSDRHSPEALHALRIEGKRLRYAMELMAGAFDETFRGELYPMVEELQERLGSLNDHATAARWFREAAAASGDAALAAALESLVAREEQAIEAETDEFDRWWTPQRIGTLHNGFAELLQS